MNDQQMQQTARARAGQLVLSVIDDDETAMRQTLVGLSTDPDRRTTAATLAVLAGMVARMARALAADDPRRTEEMMHEAVSDEIDRNAPRGQA